MIDMWLPCCHLAGGAYYEHVVTLLAEHTILLPGRLSHINFHVCVLYLKKIHTIVSSLQNILGVRSLQQLAFRVCIMAITRAGAIAAATKAVSKSRENEKRRKSAARTRKWREHQSAERQSEIRQTNRMGHAEGRACLSEERRSGIRQTDLMGHAEGHARGGKPWSITALRFKIMVKSWWKIGSNQGETQWDDGH